jgi:hypothetical protein
MYLLALLCPRKRAAAVTREKADPIAAAIQSGTSVLCPRSAIEQRAGHKQARLYCYQLEGDIGLR